MARIFLTLSIVASLLLLIAFLLGLNVGDAKLVQNQATVSRHVLTGLGSLCFATLVHAIVFTYFMGTGRWIEETSRVYKLSESHLLANRKIKYRLLPVMVLSLVMLIATGAFGGAADPASHVGFKGIAGLSAGVVHLSVAASTILLNLLVITWEFRCLERNGAIIETIMAEVRRIRTEKGLPL